MKKKKNSKPTNVNSKQASKNTPKEFVEVEIEKNFFVKTQDPDRVRLEKWQIGRRNFP